MDRLIVWFILVMSLVACLLWSNRSGSGRWIDVYSYSGVRATDYLNELDTVTVIFDNDDITFIPDGNGVGYIVYSNKSPNGNCIDYLLRHEAELFIYWVGIYPIGLNVSDPNGYYRMMIINCIYMAEIED